MQMVSFAMWSHFKSWEFRQAKVAAGSFDVAVNLRNPEAGQPLPGGQSTGLITQLEFSHARTVCALHNSGAHVSTWVRGLALATPLAHRNGTQITPNNTADPHSVSGASAAEGGPQPQLRRVPSNSHLVQEGGDVVDAVVDEQPGVLVCVVLGDLGPRESLGFLARHGDHLLISTARLKSV